MDRLGISITSADASTARTDTLTSSTAVLHPSLTVNSKANAVPFAGAEKVTIGADVLLSDTGVPGSASTKS